MGIFAVRVELHAASGEDYEVLHREMENRGFERTIKSGEGITYKLPTAEYRIDSSKNGEEIRTLARAAAATTKRKNGVIVWVYSTSFWEGLERA